MDPQARELALGALHELRLGYYMPLNVIYCTAHTTCLSQDKILAHVSLRHRLGLSFVTPRLALVNKGLSAASTDDLRQAGSLRGPPLLFLKEKKQGFACGTCEMVFASDRCARRHIALLGHARDSREGRPYLQTLVREFGKSSVLYQVDDSQIIQTSITSQITLSPDDSLHHARLLLITSEVAEKERKIANTVVPHSRMTPWLNYTQWPSMFAGVDLEEASKRVPDMVYAREEFPELVTALKSILLQGHQVICGLSNDIRLMLKGQEGRVATRPVLAVSNDTFNRYSDPLIRMVVMLITAHETQTVVEWKFDPVYVPSEVAQISILLNTRRTFEMDISADLFKLCRQLLLALARQTIVNSFRVSPIAVFMGYLAIERSGSIYKFKEAFNYTPTIAGFLYTLRSIVAEGVVFDLFQSVTLNADTVHLSRLEQLELSLLSKNQPSRLNEKLLESRNRFLNHNAPTVFRSTINLFNYARKASDIPFLPRISWSNDMSIMFFANKAITMNAFKTMIKSELADLETFIVQKLGLDGCSEVDEAFLIRLHTGFRDWEPYTKKAMSLSKKIVNLCMERQNATEFGIAASQMDSPEEQSFYFRKYQKSYATFVKKLALLIHLTGGQPSRGPELLGIRIQGANGERPNIFNDGGYLCLVTSYHKAQGLMDAERIVLRYLPFQTARLLTILLIYVRPFVNLQRELENLKPLPSTLFSIPSSKHEDGGIYFQSLLWPFIYICIARILETADLTHELGASTEKYLGERLTMSTYRHFAPALIRAHMTAEHSQYLSVDVPIEEDDDLDTFEEQAGHSASIGKAIYAVDLGLGQMTDVATGKWKAASLSYHDFIWERGFFGPDLKIRRKQTSLQKQDPLVSISSPANTLKTDALLFKDFCHSDRALAALKLLTNGYTYKSPRQAHAMNIVLGPSRLILVTMETGGGKTLLFFLPLKFPDARITIYIAPLIALTHDMSHRALAAGIATIYYTEATIRALDEGIPDGTLLIVSQEQVMQEHFKKLVRFLIAEGRLDRIVLDEAHMTVTEQSYRNTLAGVSWLMDKGSQVLMLSGTIPGFILEEMGKTLGFDVNSDVTVIRNPTVRANISYNVLKLKDGQTSNVASVTAEFLARWNAIPDLDKNEDRGILFVTTTLLAKQVASRLGCHLYIGGELDVEKRRGILADFREGVGAVFPKFIVATKALGAGVDIPHVRLVVHWNAPTSLIDYAQQAGRAGRSSTGPAKAAWAFILCSKKALPTTYGRGQEVVWPFNRCLQDLPTWLAMKDYLHTDGCFRTSLHAVLDDGLEVACSSDPSYQPCGNCVLRHMQLRMKEAEPLAANVVVRNRLALEDSLKAGREMREERQRHIERLTRFREMVVDGQCPACLYMNDQSSTTHTEISVCPKFCQAQRDTIDVVHHSMASFYESNISCFTCHFAHPVCMEWVECETFAIALIVYFIAAQLNHLRIPDYLDGWQDVAKYLAQSRMRNGWLATELTFQVADVLKANWDNN